MGQATARLARLMLRQTSIQQQQQQQQQRQKKAAVAESGSSSKQTAGRDRSSWLKSAVMQVVLPAGVREVEEGMARDMAQVPRLHQHLPWEQQQQDEAEAQEGGISPPPPPGLGATAGEARGTP